MTTFRPFLAIGMAAAMLLPGQALAQSSASDYTSATRYDELGRVVGTIAPDPDGAGSLTFLATRTTYDAAGRVTLVENGRLTSWQTEDGDPHTDWGSAFARHSRVATEYDVMGRKVLERAIGSDNVTISVTQYSYDNFGRLECTVVRMDPNDYADPPADACQPSTPAGSYGEDRITRNVYDAAGQLVQVRRGVGTSIEQAYVTYSYTANGQVEYTVDANGNRTQFVYDGHGRLERWYFPSQTGPTAFDDSTPALALATAGSVNTGDYEEYSYDDNGNRMTMRKRDGSVLSYQYDDLNRMTVRTVPGRGNLSSDQVRDVYYSYNLQGLQTAARFDNATTGDGVQTEYDGFGRVVGSTSEFVAGDPSLAFAYDRNGNRTEITFPDNLTWTYTYDGLNRFDVIKPAGSGTYFVNNNYNARGELIRTFMWSENADLYYAYDNAGRQDEQRITDGTASVQATWDFTRNPASQIVTESRDNNAYAWDGHPTSAVTTSYSINGLNQYTQVAGNSICYDANGNLIADGDWAYLYDIENRLVEMRDRVSPTTCPDATGATSTGYTGTLRAELKYDPMGRLYQVYGDQSGTTQFLYDGDAMVAEYSTAGTMLNRYVHGPAAGVDDPLIWYPGTGTALADARLLLRDPRGSIVLARSRYGAYETINSFDEYGTPGSGNDGRFQYTGQVWLEELGAYYYKARIYSPTLGRFLQTDPIGYEDNVNLYTYVGNDPVNMVDFSGKIGTCETCYSDIRVGGVVSHEQAIGMQEGFEPFSERVVEGVSIGATLSPMGRIGAGTIRIGTRLYRGARAFRLSANMASRRRAEFVRLRQGFEGNRRGTTADAVRREAATGRPTSGRWHREKAVNMRRAYRRLRRQIENSESMLDRHKAPLIRELDRAIGDLDDALSQAAAQRT